jgi:hypothetical protein
MAQHIYAPNPNLPDSSPNKELFFVDSTDMELECGFFDTENQAKYYILLGKVFDVALVAAKTDPRMRDALKPLLDQLKSF